MSETKPSNKGMLVDPGTHFDGRFELERKFLVQDLSPVRGKLGELKAVAFMLGNTETDTFLDFGDRRLEQNNQFHILRLMTPSKRVLWISKGPQDDECFAAELDDYERANMLLQSLGLKKTMEYSKCRDIYFVGVCHVTLDHVPELGSFVEIACMYDEEHQIDSLNCAIEELVNKLELTGNREINQSYRSMMLESGNMA